MRICITPAFEGPDRGDGGVRRVIEMQHEHFPKYDVEIVENPDYADIIVAHIMQFPDWLRQRSSTPIVTDCHGLYWAEYEWLPWAIKANKDVMETIRQSDAVVAHSEWVANAIRRHTMRNVETIPLSIDPRDWEPLDKKGYVLWNKTRPDPVCDPTPVIELAERMPDVQFVTTFSLPDVALPNLVETGRLPYHDAAKLVRKASIYLCTTRETFGIGTLEAMAAEAVVVGYMWGAQREILTHKVSGWLAQPGDYDSLEEGIRWGLTQPYDVIENARKLTERYEHNKIAERYVAFLQKVRMAWEERRAETRVSIIVPTYNMQEYLPDCLDSVRNQRDQDWECIVVDDASTDNSAAIAERYAEVDPRIKVIKHEKNKHHAESRHTGIAASKGRYILPLDADDQLTESAVGLLSEVLEGDRGVHIAYGNVAFVEEDGTTLKDYAKELNRDLPPGHSGWPVDFRFDWQERGLNCLPYASMFRREVWELTGGERRRYRIGEDADFWLRASSYGFRPKYVTQQDTLIYRVRSDSVSTQEKKTDWEKWYPWHAAPSLRPAGAVSEEQMPIPSCDPPIISVIIPVGPGHEDVMWDAIDSVEAQTFRQWECIVINDTGLPFKRQLPSWVKVTTAIATSGVAAARNQGISLSRSVLFLPLDADDYLLPEALDTMYEAFVATDDIIYSDWYDEKEPGKFDVYSAPDYDPRSLISRGCLHAVTALTPKDVWERVGGYDEEIPAWEDWAFQLETAAQGICSVRVPRPLFVYRKFTGQRREDNYARFQEGKEEILKRYGKYWEGEELMACSSCTGKKAPVYNGNQNANAAPQRPNGDGGAVMIQYVGEAAGSKMYKGPSGQTYVFGDGADALKYVYAQDAEYFTRLDGFRIATPAEVPVTAEPALVADA